MESIGDLVVNGLIPVIENIIDNMSNNKGTVYTYAELIVEIENRIPLFCEYLKPTDEPQDEFIEGMLENSYGEVHDLYQVIKDSTEDTAENRKAIFEKGLKVAIETTFEDLILGTIYDETIDVYKLIKMTGYLDCAFSVNDYSPEV